jgi:hypothetical protein
MMGNRRLAMHVCNCTDRGTPATCAGRNKRTADMPWWTAADGPAQRVCAVTARRVVRSRC